MAAILTLVVPVIAGLAVTALEGVLEAEFREALEAQFGPVPEALDEQLTLAALCRDPELSIEVPGACNDTTILSLLRLAAVASGVVGFAVFLLAGGTALVTRGHRGRMAMLFGPVLVIVLLGTALLLVLDAALTIGIAWEAMTVWIGWIWPWLLLVLLGAGTLSVAGVLRAIGMMLSPLPVQVRGMVLERDEHPRLHGVVDEVAAVLGTRPPDRIIGGLEPNFFVVEAPVEAGGVTYDGRTLFVSTPLSAVLTPGEFRAVIGHELGHFRGEDTAYTRRIAPLYAAGRQSLGALGAARRHWSGVMAIPAAALLSAMFDTLASGVSQVSRDRELLADAAGVQAATALELATALRKLEATSGAWPETVGAVMRAASVGVAVPDVASAYLERARRPGGAQAPRAARIPHPFDAHPPVADRIQALGLDGSAVTTPLDLAPAEAAEAYLEDPRALNAWLSEALIPSSVIGARARTLQLTAGPSRAIRSAAIDDVGVAAVAALAIERRGADLARPTARSGRWITLADLRLDRHPAGLTVLRRHGLDERPDAPWLITGVGDPAGPADACLPARTLLVEISVAKGRGFDEAAYLASTGDPTSERVVIVRNAGSGPVPHQVAGLLVVPLEDILTAEAGPVADEVAAAVLLLRDSSARFLRPTTASDGASSGRDGDAPAAPGTTAA